jgi:mono/diheme cytochrome c family protein
METRMKTNCGKAIAAALLLSVVYAGSIQAQEAPSDCVEMGAMAYDNWTKDDAGGSGSLPDGVTSADYIRCKACHGWDRLGTDGGYVRRSRTSSRPNAGAGDGDSTPRAIETGTVTEALILHEGTGRSYADGAGSWVPLDDAHSAANKAAHAGGYTLGNQHPDFSSGGPTEMQLGCLAEFLNFADADASVYFADIDPSQDPVLYTIVDTADAAAGEAFFNSSCAGCHDLQFALDYLAADGKFSEFAHKVRWGIPDTIMSRSIMGDPTAQQVADAMLYLQQQGGTGFVLNPGLTGNWWGGDDRAGEGFQIEFGYAPANGALTLFAAFYTYDNMGNQVWLVAQPQGTGEVPATGTSVDVNVYQVTGPMWGADFSPDDRALVTWGTGTFSFESCTSGSFTVTPGAEAESVGFTELGYALQRDLIISGITCPTAN